MTKKVIFSSDANEGSPNECLMIFFLLPISEVLKYGKKFNGKKAGKQSKILRWTLYPTTIIWREKELATLNKMVNKKGAYLFIVHQ
jgi:hypothetical protein